jgi:hypothetical protein
VPVEEPSTASIADIRRLGRYSSAQGLSSGLNIASI